MSMLVEAVEPMSQIVQVFNRFDEDTIDRLNHKYSTIIFVILAIVVTTNQYVGEKIECWSPAQFPEHWVEYTKSICWISNTYFIPISETNLLEANRKEIVYYQWVALVLFAQAFMFYAPGTLWISLNRPLGLDVHKIVKAAHDLEQLNPDMRDKTTKYVVKHIDRSLQNAKQIRTGPMANIKSRLASCGCFCGKRYGKFLIIIYLMTKLLYIGNAVIQLYMMNFFLGTNYSYYGIEILRDIRDTGGYKESRRFPRVTLCDFEERTLGRTIPRTVQCTLPINLFNEKIFIFVWFWLAFISIIDILSFFSWLWILFATNRRSYIKKYLKVFDKYKKGEDRDRLRAFCDKYLRQDGHFALRMIGKNTNEVIVGEMIVALWDHFGRNYNYHRKIDV
ncbi:innexin unc-9-like [Watersipora subatra]|uniref:innexin unc-9-like n=1 Tax=Watersipora subatra TaxID=2589382 RepID=UPI00355C8ACC